MKILNFGKTAKSNESSFRLVNKLALVIVAFAASFALLGYAFWDVTGAAGQTTFDPEGKETIIAISALIALSGILILVVIMRNLTHSLGAISAALAKVQAGDLKARTGLREDDQFGSIGRALDVILDERVKAEKNYKKENEDLSHAVVQLLHGVHRLSQNDLTARVEVTEDATGPIADSLNLLADEISRVLQGVVNISNDISQFCHSVKDHSDTVIEFSNRERKEVDSANSELIAASSVMMKIAELARSCNISADAAMEITSTAKDTVIDTVEGINGIREIIRETEKRIKRLGERSQEISSIVSLINSIAERTHILALNASIHAASSGEAGRGFVVVADEVQRLSENAREATAQISSLVNNMQSETSEVVVAMNNVISAVVSGSNLAEQAGEQMQETLQRTNQLVNMVQQIAVNSDEQVKAAKIITERASTIKESTEKTNKELQEQSLHADKLVQFSSQLVKAVGVFKLPQDAGRNVAQISKVR
jgi:methyl-accepting chemotaxis protein